MRRRFSYIILFLLAATLAGCSPINLTIKWEESSRHFVGRGVYGRIKKVGDSHAMVYDVGRTAIIRFSNDKCESWGKPIEVAKGDRWRLC